MKDLRGTYVHFGDRERRRRRLQGVAVAGLVVMSAILAGHSWVPAEAEAVTVTAAPDGPAPAAEVAVLRREVEGARAEVTFAAARLERWNRIFGYAREYHIAPDLATAIYDAAILERIDPELAFPLVRLESRFNERATSPVGAAGLTQLMLSTAREFDPAIDRERLYERETNLRIGFRYLRQLIRWQRGDVQMALLAYNRGPAAVEVAKELSLDASNGYDRVLLRGYRGRGVLD